MTTSTSVGTLNLRIIMREPEFPPTVHDFSTLYDQIESLLFFGTIMQLVDPTDTGRDLRAGMMVSEQVFTTAQFAVDHIRVAKASYASPIDILMYVAAVNAIGGLGGGASALAIAGINKVMKLYGQYQDLRLQKTKADVAESDARVRMAMNDLWYERIHLYRGSNLDRVDPGDLENRAYQKTLERRFEESLSVFAAADSISVEEA